MRHISGGLGEHVFVVLTSANMGADATAEEFDAWYAYVVEHIDARCGFGVDVEAFDFGAGNSEDSVYTDESINGEAEQAAVATVREALAELWEAWCAEGAPGVE